MASRSRPSACATECSKNSWPSSPACGARPSASCSNSTAPTTTSTPRPRSRSRASSRGCRSSSAAKGPSAPPPRRDLRRRVQHVVPAPRRLRATARPSARRLRSTPARSRFTRLLVRAHPVLRRRRGRVRPCAPAPSTATPTSCAGSGSPACPQKLIETHRRVSSGRRRALLPPDARHRRPRPPRTGRHRSPRPPLSSAPFLWYSIVSTRIE